MLDGCVGWPEEFATRYIKAGLWEGITVAEMVQRSALRHPDKTAVIHGELRLSYRELVSRARSLAIGLLELGLKPLDRAILQLPNTPDFATTYLAMNMVGVIPVTALRAHRHAEIRHFIRASGASAYFVADKVGEFDYRPLAAQMAAEFPTL